MIDVYLACYNGTDEPDPDRRSLSRALDAANITHEWVVWDDPSVTWSNAKVCYPRATWDYYKNPTAFIEWTKHVDNVSQLQNPASLIEWNLHKKYLLELQYAGIPVVPTHIVRQGAQIALDDIRETQQWEKLVIKPAISCGSYQTFVIPPGQSHPQWDALVAQQDMMVQPYMTSVETTKEHSCIVIDGQLTHTMVKHPRFTGQSESVTGPVEASPAQRELVQNIQEHLGAPLDYMRVDIVEDAQGQAVLAELEVIEPSLFFDAEPRSLVLFVSCIQRRIAEASQ